MPVHDPDKTVIIRGATLIDGNGGEPLPYSAIVVRGNAIAWVGPASELKSYPGARIIDLNGKTVMPGMIECHFHMVIDTEFAAVSQSEIDLTPVQWVMLTAGRACAMALKCGYTSVAGAGTAFNADFWMKRAVDGGVVLGPRIMPASREITSTGGLVDWTPSWWPKTDGFAIVVDGPVEALKAARRVLKDGAQIVKIFPSGDGAPIGEYHPYFQDCSREREVMTFEEIDAVAKETHRWGRLVEAHCRGVVSVKNCLKAGVDIINHATYLDDECLRLFRERPPLAVCPSLGFTWYMMKQNWDNPEYKKAAAFDEEFRSGCENMKKLHKMGIRIVPGGDYGQSDIPHGLYSKDLEVFVKEMEFSPLETISMATRNGSYLMKMSDKIGTIEEGKLADLLIIDGDPLKDITILQDTKKILMVMKDGKVVASRGRILSTEWDMLNEENIGVMQRIISGTLPVVQTD